MQLRHTCFGAGGACHRARPRARGRAPCARGWSRRGRRGAARSPIASTSASSARAGSRAAISNRGPATAATSATPRASSERPAVRTSTASRTLRGNGTSASTSSSRPSGEGCSPARSAAVSSSTKKGVPPVRRTGSGSAGGRWGSGELLHEEPRLALGQGLDVDLVQHPVPAQIVSQAAHRMCSRELVRAVGGDDQERELAQGERQRGQQLEGRLVRSLQVVQKDRGGTGGDHRGEAAADRLDERGAIGLGSAGPGSGSSSASRFRSGPHPARPPGAARRYSRSAAVTGPCGEPDGIAAPRTKTASGPARTSWPVASCRLPPRR